MAPFVLWHRLSGTVCPHRHRLSAPAILYVRQSTSQQLRDHQESTARQYQLTERLLAFGWPQFKCMALFVLLCLSCCLSCQFKCMALFVPSALFVPTLFVPTVCPCLSLFVPVCPGTVCPAPHQIDAARLLHEKGSGGRIWGSLDAVCAGRKIPECAA